MMDDYETSLMSESEREQVLLSRINSAFDEMFIDINILGRAKACLENGEAIQGPARDVLIAYFFKDLAKEKNRVKFRGIAESLCSFEPITDPEMVKIIDTIFHSQFKKILTRIKAPRSKLRQVWARKLLVAHMNFIMARVESIEDGIAALPEDFLELLEECGYQTEDIGSLRRLFYRSDNEFNNGEIQRLNMERKQFCKNLGVKANQGQHIWEEFVKEMKEKTDKSI